jgi:hypothetical protein
MLDFIMEPAAPQWPTWQGVSGSYILTTNPTYDKGWGVRKSKSLGHRHITKNPRDIVLNKQTANIDLARLRKHIKEVRAWKGFFARQKSKLPMYATHDPPKFEAALFEYYTQVAYAKIRDEMAGYETSPEELKEMRERSKIEKPWTATEEERRFLKKKLDEKMVGAFGLDEMLSGFSSMKIWSEAFTSDSANEQKLFSFSDLLIELSTKPPEAAYKQHSTQHMIQQANPFFDPALTLQHAAQIIHKIFGAAVHASEEWLKLVPAHFVRIAHDRQYDAVTRLEQDLGFINAFLANGRSGWDLTHLPDNFFTDIDNLITRLADCLQTFTSYKDCLFLRHKLISPVASIKKWLQYIQGKRQNIWQESKARYELEQAQSKLGDCAISAEESMLLDGVAAADSSDELGAEDCGVDTRTPASREIAKCRTRRTNGTESMVLRFGGPAQFTAGQQ